MNLLLDFFIFFFGSIVGSFLNVVILRLPEDKPLGGRSHCPNCGWQLGAGELVPLVSFLALGGKCKTCRTKISPRYFIIEAFSGLLFLTGWLVLAPAGAVSYILYIKFLLLAAVGLVIFVIDLEHYIVVADLVFGATACVLLISLLLDLVSHHSILSWHGYLVRAVTGAVLGALPVFLVWAFPPRGQWMGFGDVELMLLLGAATGFPQVFVALFVAVMAGGAVSVVLLLATKKTLKSRIPFGTLLVPAVWVALLWGPQMVHWYLGILGF